MFSPRLPRFATPVPADAMSNAAASPATAAIRDAPSFFTVQIFQFMIVLRLPPRRNDAAVRCAHRRPTTHPVTMGTALQKSGILLALS